MAELKTRETKASVPAFLKAIADSQIREDCHAIAKIMEAAKKLVAASVTHMKKPRTS